MISIDHIKQARQVVGDFNRRTEAGILNTPMIASDALSEKAKLNLLFKAECLQVTGSFKVPGAVNTLMSEMPEGCKGVFALSSGNQGLAIAYVARLLGLETVVVVPQGASKAKLSAIRAFGAEIMEAPQGAFEQNLETCKSLAHDRGLFFPNLFEMPSFMAGHGTIGLQILEDCPDLEAIVVPGGSGVLAGGLATACKSVRPDVKVYAVGVESSPGLQTAFERNQPVVFSEIPQTICDGLRSPYVSQLVVDHIVKYVDGVFSVSEEEVIEAMRLTWSHTKLLSEPSSVVPLAAAISGRLPIKENSKVVCMLTGGNVDFAQLLKYMVRGDENRRTGEQHETFDHCAK